VRKTCLMDRHYLHTRVTISTFVLMVLAGRLISKNNQRRTRPQNCPSAGAVSTAYAESYGAI